MISNCSARIRASRQALGHQHTFGLIPDVIVTGKGLSGAYYPIAERISRERQEIAEQFGSELPNLANRQSGFIVVIKMVDEDGGPIMTNLGFDFGLLAVFVNSDPLVLQIHPRVFIRNEHFLQIIDALYQIAVSLRRIPVARSGL